MAVINITRKLLVIPFLLITFLLSSCSYSFLVPADPATSFSLQGGILATLKEGNQEFHVWVTNPDTIQQFLNLQRGESHMIYGRILAGPGIDNYNAPYNWHLDSQDTQIRNTSNKGCDTKLSDLEANINYYINDVKYICSQGAVLVKVEDYRIPVPHTLTADTNSIRKLV
ncbi:MAG: hypothetical protein ACM3PY_16520 [Omnitrophica WOR_2 bacterium]